MRKQFLLFLTFVVISGVYSLRAQSLSPYIKVGVTEKTVQQAADEVTAALKAKGFEILGSYNPAEKPNYEVIAFSRKDLQNTVLKVKDRGALAAVLKVGLKHNAGGTTISYLNPPYLFNAYLRDAYTKHASALEKVTGDVKAALSPLGSENKGFGGSLSAKKLRKYHYTMMMPYFTDPVELGTFGSFEEGVKTIENNLAAGKGSTELVYELKFSSDQIAVFGIGFTDKEKGEAFFLPLIGDEEIAALPYEIIVQGKKATMLHGRYRLALHWPELSMGTFMKISSTPGDIEDAFKALCK